MKGLLPSWEIQDAGVSHDPALTYRRFFDDTQRLFSSTANRFEYMCRSRTHIEHDEAPVYESQTIEANEQGKLNEVLASHQDLNSDIFYIIKQQYSWGPLNISLRTFTDILECHRVSSSFVYFAHAFGRKLDDDDNVRDGYSLSSSSLSGVEMSEFCYNIQYFERNGRKDSPPWSLRQIGVYQQYNIESGKSRWILLNPSEYLRTRIKETLRDRWDGEDANHMALTMHLILLSAASRNWLEYMEDLHSEIKQLNQKACFSRVGKKCLHDYKITFDDCQRLQRLREQTQRTIMLLDSSAEIVKGYRSLGRKLRIFDGKPSGKRVLENIEGHSLRIRRHRKKACFLLDQCLATAELTSKIIEFRDGELAQRNYQAMRESLEFLKHISLQGREENFRLTELAIQSRKDSRILKALTIVATTYLPGTFIATIFSSNLVQTVSRQNGENHLVIANQFWVFVVVTLPLMVITLGLTLWLERRWLRNP